MKSMPWFRMWNDARTDRKIASLTDAQHRVWFNLLCLASENEERGTFTYDECLAIEVADGDEQILDDTLKHLIQIDILWHDDQSLYRFIAWNKRQSLSLMGLRPSPSEWMQMREFVFERDNYTCSYCGVRGGRLECDHVIPLSRGGSHEPSNLVTACFTCNRSKHAKTPDEWRGLEAAQ